MYHRNTFQRLAKNLRYNLIFIGLIRLKYHKPVICEFSEKEKYKTKNHGHMSTMI